MRVHSLHFDTLCSFFGGERKRCTYKAIAKKLQEICTYTIHVLNKDIVVVTINTLFLHPHAMYTYFSATTMVL